MLGLVSTKVPELGKVDNLKRRIDEAAKYAPLDQLAISPQCGFSSDVVGNLISADDQKRKLEVVVETARQVWGVVPLCGESPISKIQVWDRVAYSCWFLTIVVAHDHE